ncbi:MAG TPA: mycofactocin biosynthesis glycosyltransferase MftF [Acidimicrobiales bacterium]|nr:mycofactocin biosynthesis glycosyltransferase MftF [Acidimicrobiales bacterium]
MPAATTPDRPPSLVCAPDRRTTPLPGSFTLHPAPATVHLDGGAVVLGGSPLRLFRISERARTLLEWWRVGHPVGERRGVQLLARRLVSSGAYVPRPTTPTFRKEDVTVVIPVRDRATGLDRLLAAVSDLACVVVDDASVEAGATKEVAERHGARFVPLADNAGPAGARDAGWAVVDTALVAFIDSDCVPSPGWLDPLLGHFDDPVVGAVAPRVVPLARTPRRALDRYERVRSSLDRGASEGPVRRGSPISYVPSAALVVRVAVTTGPDLFDATLRGGEDVDLVWRLADAGWDVRYVPASTVEHDGPATLGEFLARRAFYGTSAAPLARRHPGALSPLHVSAWSFAVWLLALARRPLLALTTLAASVGLLAHRLRGLTGDPVGVATRIAGDGTVRAAMPALASLARTGSPALLVGLAFRRTRRAAALALLLPALADWWKDRGDLDPASYVALHVADDVAYGAGVWLGCARERTVAPLVPRLAFRARVWSARSLRENLAPKGAAPTTPA